jgi:hypothetical protein
MIRFGEQCVGGSGSLLRMASLTHDRQNEKAKRCLSEAIGQCLQIIGNIAELTGARD